MGQNAGCCLDERTKPSQASQKTKKTQDEIAPDAKAIFPLLTTKRGPDPSPANNNLKLLLTSAGLMPQSTTEQVERYKYLAKKTSGKGVLYLLDAKLKTLQWQEHGHKDPETDNDEAHVAYKREPDEPGGKPVLEGGQLVMKTQAELLKMGHASVEYALKHNKHYSNGHLSILATGTKGEEVPIYLSYLAYDGNLYKSGQPEYNIMIARGYFKDNDFQMYKAGDGSEFSEADYEAPTPKYNQAGSLSFAPMAAEDFAKLVDSVNTIWSCGGVTWQTVMALQPHFIDDGKVLDIINPYGKAVLDAVKSGSVVYVGQSAGTVALSWNIGSLTTDPTAFHLEGEEDELDFIDFDFELGETKMLEPGLGAYLGIPYRLVFRPHLSFNMQTCSYGGRAMTAKNLSSNIDSLHDVYCITTADYNFSKGQGDIVELSNGKVRYLIGHSDDKIKLCQKSIELMKAAEKKHHWSRKVGDIKTLRRQPKGPSAAGSSFQWKPSQGEVHAAGPFAKQAFRIYASCEGLLEQHPLGS